VGLTFDRDGEFWMSFRDFSAHYSRLEIVNLNADSLEEEELSGNNSKRWSANEFAGNWVKGASAGGCRNHLGNDIKLYILLRSRIHILCLIS
jgi:calpain